jgi:hypothetical protein
MRILRLVPLQVKQNRAAELLFRWLFINYENSLNNLEKAAILQ